MEKKLGFFLNYNSSLNSTFGGVFTCITALVYVALFNFFAKDFYFRINPKITSEKVFFEDINNYTITNEKTIFAVSLRLVKDPRLYKLSAKYREVYVDNIINIDFDMISCNSLSNSYNIDEDELQNLYCMDFNKFLNKNITNFSSISLLIKKVRLEIQYNFTYLETLNDTYRQNMINSDDFILYFYPVFSFSPNNY